MNEKQPDVKGTDPSPEGSEHGHTIYAYTTAGITEREGRVPTWLWVVVISLLIWGAYYIFTYWYDTYTTILK
jgi:hypothetical protein